MKIPELNERLLGLNMREYKGSRWDALKCLVDGVSNGDLVTEDFLNHGHPQVLP